VEVDTDYRYTDLTETAAGVAKLGGASSQCIVEGIPRLTKTRFLVVGDGEEGQRALVIVEEGRWRERFRFGEKHDRVRADKISEGGSAQYTEVGRCCKIHPLVQIQGLEAIFSDLQKMTHFHLIHPPT
jgi:hypothetical protein